MPCSFYNNRSEDQSSDVNSAVRSPGLIGYTGQIVRALPVEGGDEVLGCPNSAETSEHDGGAVGDVDHRVIEACVDFIFHLPRLLQNWCSR